MSRAGSPDLSCLSRLLGHALHKGDSDEFLKIYDSLIPENLPPSQLEQIKEQARLLALKLDRNSGHDGTTKNESSSSLESINELSLTLTASPMSELQKCKDSVVDEHRRHSEVAFDYVPNMPYDASVTARSSPIEPENSLKKEAIDPRFDEEHNVESSMDSDQSHDELLLPQRQPAGGTAIVKVKDAFNDQYGFRGQAVRLSNGESGALHFSSDIPGKSRKADAAAVDQSLILPLSRPASVAPAKDRYASVSSKGVSQESDGKNVFWCLQPDTTADRLPTGLSRSRELRCDENGNPLELHLGAPQYCLSPKNVHEMPGSSRVHRLIDRDRDEQQVRGPDKDTAHEPVRARGKKSGRVKEDKSILAKNIPGHRGGENVTVEELLSYINGSKQPVEAAGVTNGHSKLEKKMKKAGEKGKKTGHEASALKIDESKPANKLCSSLEHSLATGGEVVVASKAALSVDHGTPVGSSWVDSFEKEQQRNVCENVAASYTTAAFAALDGGNVNVSSTVTTSETFSIDLIAEMPSCKSADHKQISSIPEEPLNVRSGRLHFETGYDRLLDVVQPSESFLTVSKKKKLKDISSPARCAPVGMSRRGSAGYHQTNHRLHGPSATSSAPAPCDPLAHAASSFKDAVVETHTARGSCDASLPEDGAALFLTKFSHDAAVDFPPMRPAEKHDESLETGAGASAAGSDSSAAATYTSSADESSQKRTWAKVASKPATAAGSIDLLAAPLEPIRELQHKVQLPDVDGTGGGRLPCVAAGAATACPSRSPELADACSASCEPDIEPKPQLPQLPAVSMPSAGAALPPTAGLVFGYSADMLCDSQVPANVMASATGSVCHRERPLKGVEFCGSMLYALPATFTIRFGCGDSLDDECEEPFGEGLQFGEPQLLQQQDVCCSSATADCASPAAFSEPGSLPLAPDILATSPMVEGQLGARLVDTAPDYDQLPHIRAVQFLTKEYTAVMELLRKHPNRVVVYADSEDGKWLAHT